MQDITLETGDRAGSKVIDVRALQTHFFTHDGVVAAVEGLSFDVAPGEMIGLVGESGCGKSTAALSIMRLLPPQGHIVGGQILLNGRDIAPLSKAQMRSVRGAEVAMIFQDALAALDPTMKVGEQLMEPLRIHRQASLTEARQMATELLAKVGIPSPRERLNSYPHQFSGGMRQRAMIAIALSCDPKLLIADEPTTALDVTVQKQILQLMLRLRDETGAGIVIITHDVGVVAETCDRVVVMYAGREVESGPTQAVFQSPAHPYTIGLLGSTLDLRRDRRKPLQAIPGLPPTLIDLPPGCPFWPRCPRHTEVCKAQMPSLETVETVTGFHGSTQAAHEAACWHLDDRR